MERAHEVPPQFGPIPIVGSTMLPDIDSCFVENLKAVLCLEGIPTRSKIEPEVIKHTKNISLQNVYRILNDSVKHTLINSYELEDGPDWAKIFIEKFQFWAKS